MTNSTNYKQGQFLKLPLSLWYEQPYSSMSLLAKNLYVFLIDRQSYSDYSVSKGDTSWIDKNGDTFCIMTNTELVGIFKLSEKTIINAKKELVEAGLLKQVKGGFNQPMRLYVYDLTTEVSVSEQPVKETLTEGTTEKSSDYLALPTTTIKILDTNKDTYTPSLAESNYTSASYKDRMNALDNEINTHASEILNNGVNDTIFENKAITIMQNLTGSVAGVRELTSVIFNAKKHVEKKLNKFLLLEEREESVTFTLRNIVEVYRNKGITNLKGFTYKSFYNLFEKSLLQQGI